MRNILHEIWHIQVHLANLIACIEEIRDPRIERGKKHDLVAIILISILAVSSGAKNWVEVVEFAHDHAKWLRSQIWLPNGIPSHDTFTRVFTNLPANEFKGWLLLWLEVALESRGDHIAFDGKIIKCWTADNPFTLVSAFCTSAKIVLEQARVPSGKNELAALDRVLSALNLKGKVVTIDAIGTNKLLVKKIVEKGGDYVLPVKLNHPLLYEDITLFMNTLADGGHEEIEYDYYETHDHAHGRTEIRRCFSTNYIAWLPQRKEW